ncbi:protein C1orf194 homolog isoform X1 [Gracilinanus agilis]|uniref:protein C1orf194 homolog isoform X1 n=1 Tax=Gracilinanus agilis TaxID=191870 RepID=UPI001CFD30BC|nr:protein C1orf194 homolog isoform X1 [Gracilinanus agilis]
MSPTRDPLQNPKFESEDSYVGKREGQKLSSHLIQQQNPWHRLHAATTIASIRRDVYFYDPEIPQDDLDFRITSLYNHHTGLFQDKAQSLVHHETVHDTHGVIKLQHPDEIVPPTPLPPITSRALMRHWMNPKKESIHSVQGTIVAPHTAATNGGYSRKTDGGFFST